MEPEDDGSQNESPLLGVHFPPQNYCWSPKSCTSWVGLFFIPEKPRASTIQKVVQRLKNPKFMGHFPPINRWVDEKMVPYIHGNSLQAHWKYGTFMISGKTQNCRAILWKIFEAKHAKGMNLCQNYEVWRQTSETWEKALEKETHLETSQFLGFNRSIFRVCRPFFTWRLWTGPALCPVASIKCCRVDRHRWGKASLNSQLVAKGVTFPGHVSWSCETLGGMTGFFLKVIEIIKSLFFFFLPILLAFFLVERVDYACILGEHL